MKKLFLLLILICTVISFINAQESQKPEEPKTAPVLPQGSKADSASKTGERKAELLLQYGYSSQVGNADFSSYFNSGTCSGFAVLIPVGKNLLVRTGASYTNMSFKKDSSDSYAGKLNGNLDGDVSKSTRLELVNIDLMLGYTPTIDGPFSIYALAGARLVTPYANVSNYYVVNSGTNDRTNVQVTYKRSSSIAATGVVGAGFKVTKFMAINVEASFQTDLAGKGTLATNIISTLNPGVRTDYSKDLSKLGFFNISGGLRFFLK